MLAGPGAFMTKHTLSPAAFGKKCTNTESFGWVKDGLALADTAWGVGSELVITQCTVADGSTES